MATTIQSQSWSIGQEEEINSLRDHFKDNIRILSSIGQFSYIVKIRADQYDVSLTLQLDKSYPAKLPEIILTAPRLTPEQISLVQQLLQSYSESLLNHSMVLSIYTRLLKWFDDNHIQTLTITNNPPSIPRSPTNGKLIIPFPSVCNTNDQKGSQCDEHEEMRKSSMKTAEDVIARLERDTRLDKRYFRVGYIDPLLGLQEKPYNDFDFKQDASTITDRQTNTLNVPKHRIQYFKYVNEIIWDKASRTDLIFGSTGNQQTIADIIQRHETLPERKIHQDEKLLDVDHTLSSKRYLTINDGLHKPNYLLSIPITDPSFITHYITYRDHLLSAYPSLFSSSSSIDPHHLHLTLLTLRLETSQQIEQIILALKRIQEEIHYHCSYPERIWLEFQGMDTFYGKILFIKCQANHRLENLRTLIIERLYEQKEKQKISEVFFAGNYQEFIPHIVLFKNKRKLASIDPHQTEKIFFGKQTIDALELSSIQSNENEPQKNHCIFKLDLS